MISTISLIRLQIIGVLTFVVNICNAQSWQKTDLGVQTEINDVKIEISFYSPSIVRIIKSPKDHSFTKESLSIIKKPQQTTFNVKQQSDLLNLTSERLRISLNVKSGDLTYYTKNGNLLLKEKEGSTKWKCENTENSLRASYSSHV